MTDERGPLEGLEEKSFDQIFDETTGAMQDRPPEKMHAAIAAKMAIRELVIRKKKRQQEALAEIRDLEPNEDLYKGWVLFEVAECGKKDTSLKAFRQVFLYLKSRKPDTLLFMLSFWEHALEHGGEQAAALYRQHRSEVMEQVKHALANDGDMNDAMVRFVETMSKPDPPSA